jgi:hypothetical protein
LIRPERVLAPADELVIHVVRARDVVELGEQGATKSDVAELAGRLQRIENLLSAPR